MGILDDLAMGLGFKDRDADYYERTAKTLGRTKGAGREAQYRQSHAFTEQPTRGGPAAMLGSGQRGGWGYGEGDSRVSALRDMLDGGGRGRAGQRFEGGLLADLANALGIRPLGYQERLAAARPMARPTRPAAPAAPATSIRPQARPRPAAMGDWGAPVDMSWVDSSPLRVPDVQTYPLSEFGKVMQRVYELGDVNPSYDKIRNSVAGDWGDPVNIFRPQGMSMGPTQPTEPTWPASGSAYSRYLRGFELPPNQTRTLQPFFGYNVDTQLINNPLVPSFVNTRTNTQLYGDPLGSGKIVRR